MNARGLAPADPNAPTRVHFCAPDEDLGDDLILSGSLRGEIEGLARELRQVDRFLRVGVDPPTRVLFSGPSGTGKTLAARWLGCKLKATVGIVDISSVIGSHLGESARGMRSCFEAILARPGAILFFDEIDAICLRRDRVDDGADAELARATSTFFQQIDALAPGRIVIAATNFPDDLDDALRRRLTTEIAFSLPDLEARRRMLERWLSQAPLCAAQLDAIASDTEGLSGAQLWSRAMAQARRAIMALPDDKRGAAARGLALAPAVGVARGQEILQLLDSMGGTR